MECVEEIAKLRGELAETKKERNTFQDQCISRNIAETLKAQADKVNYALQVAREFVTTNQDEDSRLPLCDILEAIDVALKVQS